jgi:3-oxoadipate enol-lactonase
VNGLHHAIDGPADGPVVVLGGSLGTTVDMWRPQLPALAGRYRVVRYDHRGHGKSPVPPGPYAIAQLGGDVLDLLDTLELDRVGYCGLSLGGMVGMWLAAHAPDRISRLVLLCTAAHLPEDLGYRARATLVRDQGLDGIADAVVGRWFTPAFADASPYRAMLVGTPPEGYAGCCVAIADLDLRADLPAITAPTLVVAGADDPAIPPPYAVEIARGIPGSRLEIVPGAAHLANVERPEAVTRLIVEHLD